MDNVFSDLQELQKRAEVAEKRASGQEERLARIESLLGQPPPSGPCNSAPQGAYREVMNDARRDR